MTKRLARHLAASVALAALSLATPALAQDTTVTIGVLTDKSSLKAVINGPSAETAVILFNDASDIRTKD